MLAQHTSLFSVSGHYHLLLFIAKFVAVFLSFIVLTFAVELWILS